MAVPGDAHARTILLISADKQRRQRLGAGLRELGYAVHTAGSFAEAEHLLPRQPVDLVVAELGDPPELAAITALQRKGPTVVTLGATSPPSLASAALAAGAYDHLPRSAGAAEIRLCLEKAAAREARLGDRSAARFVPTAAAHTPKSSADPRLSEPPAELLIHSPAMRELWSQLVRAARTDVTVLLLGESGTGKELLCRALHRLSPRRDAPFLALNCGALPEPLLESLLFGHIRGAFTGAVRDQHGAFEEAHGGTLFLDEIGDMPLSLQVKLLRALQDRKVQPVGAQEPIDIDVRIVAATLRDLEAEVAAGRFRADLYYRLSVVPLRVPPLRERPEDVLPLAARFLARAAEKLHKPLAALSEAAQHRLARHSYPGNVRELENAIERAAVLTESTVIDAPDLPLVELGTGAENERHEEGARPDPLSSIDLRTCELAIKPLFARIEAALIRRALAECRGNRSAAARKLGLSHRALLYKLRDYGLDS